MLRIAMAALVAGFALTVGVALGCVYWLSPDTSDVHFGVSSKTIDRLVERAPQGFSLDESADVVVVHAQGVGADMLTYAFSRTTWGVVDDDVRLIWGGWPLRCLTGEFWVNGPPQSFEHRNFVLLVPRIDRGGFRGHVFLPTKPQPFGFAVNWLSYSIIISCFLALLIKARKLIRRIRSRCEDCGYDVRFSPKVCPECGRER